MLGANLLFGGAEPILGPLSPVMVMGAVAGISQMGATTIALYGADKEERNPYLQPAITVGLSTAALYLLTIGKISFISTHIEYAGLVAASSFVSEPAFKLALSATGSALTLLEQGWVLRRHSPYW